MNSDFNQELGGWIKATRIQAGLTEKDASRNLGVPINLIEEYECGRAMPLRTLKRFAKLYEVEPNKVMAKVLELSIRKMHKPPRT